MKRLRAFIGVLAILGMTVVAHAWPESQYYLGKPPTPPTPTLGAFAVGTGGKAASTTNGTTWTARSPGAGTASLTSCGMGGGYVVAINTTEFAYSDSFSSDWATASNPATTMKTYVISTDNINDAAMGGTTGALYITTNGLDSFTSVTSQFGTNSINAGVYGDGKYVIVGNSGKISTSTDSAFTTWTARTSNTTENLYAITYAGGYFIAVGAGSTIDVSPDAVTWTVYSSNIPGSPDLYSVAGLGGKWVVGGVSATATDPLMASSYDAKTWNPFKVGVSATGWYAMQYEYNTFIAFGTNGSTGLLYTSPTGDFWTAQTSPFTGANYALSTCWG